MSEPLVLVPLDGTPQARAALPVAKAMADLMGASLHVVHVSDQAVPPLPELAERLGLGREVLEHWAIDARTGDPSTAIIGAARELHVRLIVMCTHTSTVSPPAILGHTALDVLRDAPCPVVLVSPEHAVDGWRPDRIVLPHDGSPAADAAVGPAAELARLAGAELLVLQVGTGGGAPAERGSLAMPRYVDQPQHEWPSWTHELLGRLACLCPGCELHAHLQVRGGAPGPEIVRLAAEQAAGLIVLAWKGDWTAEHAGTLKTVIREGPCPVMIVHAGGA